MNHLNHTDIKLERVKLFINTLLLDHHGEINNTWNDWIYEIRLFLNLDDIALTAYKNIVNINSHLYLPNYNQLLGIIFNINDPMNGPVPEIAFCRHMWLYLYH